MSVLIPTDYTVTGAQIMRIGDLFRPGSNARKINSGEADQIAEAANAAMKRGDIKSFRRIRYFLTQAAFETAYFTKWTEVLYYSAPRLPVVWPSRFYYMDGAKKIGNGPRNAVDYAGNPEKLANAVYADRFGNGDEASGDGWHYRGRGAFHLTFSDNYRDASRSLYGDDRLLTNPDQVAEYPAGLDTAVWFWNSRKLSALADADEFTKMTGVINGSTSTAPVRLELLGHVNKIIV